MLLFSIADYSHPLVGGMLIGLSAVMLWWSIAKMLASVALSPVFGSQTHPILLGNWHFLLA